MTKGMDRTLEQNTDAADREDTAAAASSVEIVQRSKLQAAQVALYEGEMRL